MKPIRVLVCEDSLVFQELLVKSLKMTLDIEVVATATDPFEARDAIVQYKPDVMTLDIELPKMNGIDFLRKLMPQYPMPVIVISSLSDRVFDALNAGAVDFVAKPAMTDRKRLEQLLKNDLPNKIRVASVAKLGINKLVSLSPVDDKLPHLAAQKTEQIVAIGASTGGTEAISTVIRQFKKDIPGVVIVQHMPAGFTESFANRLDKQCEVEVREAKNGDRVVPGLVLIAPGGDAHMSIIKAQEGYQVQIKQAPKVNGHCPSVDVLFNSVAKVAGANAVGVILTGMGGDGSKGLLAMRKAGARTIGQDASTCVVYGMPCVAYELGAVEYQEKLQDVAKRTYLLLNGM